MLRDSTLLFAMRSRGTAIRSKSSCDLQSVWLSPMLELIDEELTSLLVHTGHLTRSAFGLSRVRNRPLSASSVTVKPPSSRICLYGTLWSRAATRNQSCQARGALSLTPLFRLARYNPAIDPGNLRTSGSSKKQSDAIVCALLVGQHGSKDWTPSTGAHAIDSMAGDMPASSEDTTHGDDCCVRNDAMLALLGPNSPLDALSQCPEALLVDPRAKRSALQSESLGEKWADVYMEGAC